MKQGSEKGVEFIVKALNERITEDQKIWICLEGLSGKVSEIGRSFEAIKAIIDGIKHNERLGVCLDSCHLYSAGYVIFNDLDGVVDAFDKTIALK